nr:MAG TPA: hypothetical protein [Caudoviricetes sp.]
MKFVPSGATAESVLNTLASPVGNPNAPTCMTFPVVVPTSFVALLPKPILF